MRILLTGGAGFIGSHLTERLIGRNDQVTVLDNLNDYYDPTIKRSNMSTYLDSPQVTFVEGDIRDTALLEKVFENKFDVIVHLAARAGVRPSLQDPLLYEDVNCRGTLNLLEMARKNDINRFVFASSSSVYGDSCESPFSEEAQIDKPLSPYGATKAAGELFCYNYFHLYGISCNALRFFTVYGARQRPDMAIHKFTRLIDEGTPIPFYGDGTTERDYTYYTDIIDGVVASIDNDLGFEIFNLGESQTTQLNELVALIGDSLGKKAVLDRQPQQPGDVKMTCADVSKAKKLLGYQPTTPVSDGVPKFVEWYKQQS